MISMDQRRRESPWMDTVEAADYLGAKAGTLKNWRHRGEGPKYHVVNRRLVRYHQTELDAFASGSAVSN
jgi:excisionase family DNA binding protein